MPNIHQITANAMFIASLTIFPTVAANQPELMQAYLSGVQGNASANKQALQQLSAAQKANPTDVALLAMLGAVQTSAAKHAWMPWNKMQAAEQGLARLDKALRQLPADNQQPAAQALTMQVHSIAGCTFINLPDMFNRFEQGYQLLKNQLQSPALQYAPVSAQQALYSCGAAAANKAGDTELASAWQQQLTNHHN